MRDKSAVEHSGGGRIGGGTISALGLLVRLAAANARGDAPPPPVLEGGVENVRAYYEASPELCVSEAAVAVARLAAERAGVVNADAPDAASPTEIAAAALGFSALNILGALIEAEGQRYDPFRASAMYFRALYPHADTEGMRAFLARVGDVLGRPGADAASDDITRAALSVLTSAAPPISLQELAAALLSSASLTDFEP